MTRYEEILDGELQARVNARYRVELAAIEASGFRRFVYVLESLGPLSAVVQFPVVIMMRNAKEVLSFPFPLRLATAYPILISHRGPASMAHCMGLGTKFYSSFTDGTLLISSTLSSHADLDPLPFGSQSKVLRNRPYTTAEEACDSHRERCAELETQGKTIRKINSFSEAVEVSRIEEADLRSRF